MRASDLTRLWFATLAQYMASGFVFPLFPIYMAYRGLTTWEVGLVVSIATIVSIVPTMVIGRFSDVMGGERVQLVIGLGLAFLIPFYIFLNSLLLFIIAHSLYLVLIFSYMTLAGSIAMDYIRSSRGTRFGRFRTSGALGWILGCFLGGVVVESIGFIGVFLVSCIVFIVSAFLFGFGSSKRKIVSDRVGASSFIRFDVLRDLMFNRLFFYLMISVFVASLTTPAYYTFLPLYMTRVLNTSSFMSSLTFSITPLAEIPAMVYFGALSDRFGRVNVIALCFLAYPLRYLLTVSVGNPFLVILVQLLHGLTFGGLYVVSTAYISEIVSEDRKGLALSLYTVFMNLGSFIGNYILGWVADFIGFETMYYLAALISSFSIVIILLSKKFS